MSQPMVTVLLAVHNGLPEVARAVDSILAQEFEDLEFLVIDDGSTDGTPEYLAGLVDRRVRVIRVEHQGLAAALNLGIGEARGTYIARQDDDEDGDQGRVHKRWLACSVAAGQAIRLTNRHRPGRPRTVRPGARGCRD